jgi:hypothetical protein
MRRSRSACRPSRGYRDRPDVERGIAHDPRVVAEGGQNPPVPLVHQVAHGRHHQGRHLRAGHGGERHLRLARARRHDDLPAPAGLQPGVEGLPLLRPQRRQILARPDHGNRQRHLIMEARPEAPDQSIAHDRVVNRLAAPRADARIPRPERRAGRRSQLARRHAPQHERPALERKRDVRAWSAVCHQRLS